MIKTPEEIQEEIKGTKPCNYDKQDENTHPSILEYNLDNS